MNENSGEFSYYLSGEPKSYITHRDRTCREWSPNKSAHQLARVTLESQHDGRSLFKGPIDMSITFYFKFPCHTLRRQRVGPFHETSPSLLYLYRFIEEV